jgi:VWFA-related protein
MVKFRGKSAFLSLLVVIVALAPVLEAQDSKVPDAPSATRPTPTSPFPAGTKPAPQTRENEDKNNSEQQAPAPPMKVDTLPPGSRPRSPDDDGTEKFKITVDVNFITVPVTVKDPEGRLVEGLVRKDFAIYEDGVPQNLRLFTSDPFPLSAALVIDQGMSATTMKKVNETLPSIVGAFGPYDEVAVYTYDNNVRQVSDFGAAGDQLLLTLRRSKRQGRTGGVQVIGGPLGQPGPTVNGRPAEPSGRTVNTPIRETRALNDALLKAALDLSNRERSRRRIIFVISDGQELDSSASYSEVLKVLLSNEIIVYSIGVDAAGIPGLQKIARARIPGLGTSNILPKYVSATGGEYFSELTRAAIERTYARLTEVARNQYTLGYVTRTTPASNYRTIEVRVKRPGLKVYARDGYYPLPPKRTSR